jgi:hypothetical protein
MARYTPHLFSAGRNGVEVVLLTFGGRPKVDVALERRAQRQLEKGVGILKVAKMVGLGTGTVQRIKQEMRAT